MREMIDLTYDIHNGMIKFDAPWHCYTELVPMGSVETCGRNTTKITIGSHVGTHMDAPKHFVEDGKTIDQIDLNKMMGPLTICDLTDVGEGEAISIERLKQFKLTSKVLLKTGWGKHWNTGKFYKNYPYIPLETAQYIYEQGVEVLALDTPSPDDSSIILGSKQDSMIHKFFLSRNVILIEYVAHLDQVVDYEGWSMVAAPLKLQGVDGSPIRMWISRGEY